MAHINKEPLMLEHPSIVKLEQQTVAVIKLIVPRPDLPAIMGPAIAELNQALRAQGIKPTGPLFSHHFRMDDAVFDFEVGTPVDRPVAATGRVTQDLLPAMTAAQVTYRGGYEGLSDAWGKLRKWIDESRYRPAPGLRECYAAGPETSNDPAQWRTDLYQGLLE